MDMLTKITDSIKNSYIPVFIDVSKDYLDYTIQPGIGRKACSGRISYRLDELENWVDELVASFRLRGAHDLQFVCEPTGGYQYKLEQLAQKHDAKLVYVDSERMYNARILTYGNSEKTDRKDPGAIAGLYRFGRVRPAARRDTLREQVRCLSHHYEALSAEAIRCRNQIQGLLNYVFIGYTRQAKFTFSRTGQALAKEFKFCPQLILVAGFDEFVRRIKSHVPRVRRATLNELWAMAESSVRFTHTMAADPRLPHLNELYGRWMELEQKKSNLKARLCQYAQQCKQQGWLPRHLPPGVSPWMLIRVIAETGPFGSFSHIHQLWAFMGLKLACRQSGKYKGRVKITKKGSPLTRKLLFQICLPLVKKGAALHGLYRKYHPDRSISKPKNKKKNQNQSKSQGKGIRAMVAVMRKLVRILWALHRNSQRFDPDRVSRRRDRDAVS